MRTPPMPTGKNNYGFTTGCIYQYREIIWVDLTKYSQKTIDQIVDNKDDITFTVKSGYAIVLGYYSDGECGWYEVGMIDDGRVMVETDRMFKVGNDHKLKKQYRKPRLKNKK